MISEEGFDLNTYSHPPYRRLSSLLCGRVCRRAGIVLVPRDSLPFTIITLFPKCSIVPAVEETQLGELFQDLPRLFDFALKLLRGVCGLTLRSS